MKHLLYTLILLATVAQSSLYSQKIFGKVSAPNGYGISGLQVQLYINPNIFTTTSNNFGDFAFKNITNVKCNSELPDGYSVSDNYPNPFNPKTRIEITLPNSGSVHIGIYNMVGQKVLDDIERYYSAGTNSIDLELNGLPNGIYFARIDLDGKYTVTKKLILIYGSQHLSSANSSKSSSSRLNKTANSKNSILDTKIDSIVITGKEIKKTVFKNLPNVVESSLNVGNLYPEMAIVLTPPILLSPLNNSTNVSTSPVLSWSASSDATEYRVVVGLNQEPYSNIFEKTIGNATSFQVTGLQYYTKYRWTIGARNNYLGEKMSGTLYFTTIPEETFQQPCPNIPTETYEGKVYNTIQIASQCWLKENINAGTMIVSNQDQTNNSVIEKYCYNNDLNNCNIYGGLYQWAEIMKYQDNATNTTSPFPAFTGNVKGICPDGWHIPTITEFRRLMQFGGNALKSIGQGTGVYAGTNTTGFSGLLAGYKNLGGNFENITSVATFHTASEGYENAANTAYYFSFFDGDGVGGSYNDKRIGRSVRCLKD